MRIICFAIIISLSITYSSAVTARKKKCQSYLDHLRNIQSQQRAGYSNRQGKALAKKEQKARDKWWRCKQGKQVKNNQKTKHKAKERNKRTKQTKPTITKINPQNFRRKGGLNTPPRALTNTVVLKAKYTGIKQQHWLNFYRQPSRCRVPKSTQEFAFCIENKHQQQKLFEANYKGN